MYSTLKSLQNADGLKVSLNDEISKTLDVIKAFWGCAGSKINNSKNECILLEDMKNEFEKLHGIRVTNKIIKCKGIYVGNDKEECYNENWRRIHQYGKPFESWKRRKLTLFIKACFIRTLATCISKLIYIFSILCLLNSNFIKKYRDWFLILSWRKQKESNEIL